MKKIKLYKVTMREGKDLLLLAENFHSACNKARELDYLRINRLELFNEETS